MHKLESHSSPRDHQVFQFLGLTFLLTWGVWIPLVILGWDTHLMKMGTFGPTFAALILIIRGRGKSGLIKLGQKLTLWRVSWGWYAFVFLGPPLIMLGAVQIYTWMGGAGLTYNDPGQWYLTIPIFFFVLFTSVLGEEIGWRGFALPGLLEKHNALAASLILGVIWGLWHLPLFWMAGDFHREIPFFPFLLQCTASAVIYSWLYVNTRGSLLIAHLFHAVSNTAAGLLPVLPGDTGGSLQPFYLTVGLLVLAAMVVVILFGVNLKLSETDGVVFDQPGPEVGI